MFWLCHFGIFASSGLLILDWFIGLLPVEIPRNVTVATQRLMVSVPAERALHATRGTRSIGLPSLL